MTAVSKWSSQTKSLEADSCRYFIAAITTIRTKEIYSLTVVKDSCQCNDIRNLKKVTDFTIFQLRVTFVRTKQNSSLELVLFWHLSDLFLRLTIVDQILFDK